MTAVLRDFLFRIMTENFEKTYFFHDFVALVDKSLFSLSVSQSRHIEQLIKNQLISQEIFDNHLSNDDGSKRPDLGKNRTLFFEA